MTLESDSIRKLEAVSERAPGRTSRLGRVPMVLAALAAVAAVAALAIALAPADAQPIAATLAILALGTVAAWRVLGRSAAVTASTPERFELELAQPPLPVTEIAGLQLLETDLRMSTASAFGLEFKLKPMLRELATWKLARNHGVDMAAEPDEARRILGDPLWGLLGAGPAYPEFRDPGAPLEDVQAGLDQLERI